MLVASGALSVSVFVTVTFFLVAEPFQWCLRSQRAALSVSGGTPRRPSSPMPAGAPASRPFWGAGCWARCVNSLRDGETSAVRTRSWPRDRTGHRDAGVPLSACPWFPPGAGGLPCCRRCEHPRIWYLPGVPQNQSPSETEGQLRFWGITITHNF